MNNLYLVSNLFEKLSIDRIQRSNPSLYADSGCLERNLQRIIKAQHCCVKSCQSESVKCTTVLCKKLLISSCTVGIFFLVKCQNGVDSTLCPRNHNCSPA